jgi:putative flippase GtrA
MRYREKLVAFRNRVLAFGLVGGIGFAVEAVILQGLSYAGVQPIMGRAFSFPVAVTATWLLNKHYTFRDRPVAAGRTQYLLYVGGQIGGALINICAFVLTIRRWPALSTQPVVPLTVGSALGLIFNYAWANALVFKDASPAPASNQ